MDRLRTVAWPLTLLDVTLVAGQRRRADRRTDATGLGCTCAVVAAGQRAVACTSSFVDPSRQLSSDPLESFVVTGQGHQEQDVARVSRTTRDSELLPAAAIGCAQPTA
jgi:hypothetical protein